MTFLGGFILGVWCGVLITATIALLGIRLVFKSRRVRKVDRRSTVEPLSAAGTNVTD